MIFKKHANRIIKELNQFRFIVNKWPMVIISELAEIKIRVIPYVRTFLHPTSANSFYYKYSKASNEIGNKPTWFGS